LLIGVYRVGCCAALIVTTGVLAPVARAEPSEHPYDAQGFVGTAAYCPAGSTAVAYGRTAAALVTICGADGEFQYRGVRLSDDAAVMVDAERDPSGAFVAGNGGVTYTVTPQELVVRSGDDVIHRSTMVEYHQG
jgi:hypothetical protein